MLPEEVHRSANRVKSRGLVLSVKPERFRLPFVSNTSVPVTLENKNNYPISYSVDTSSPMSLTIDPKDGYIEPGQEAHIIIRRPSRIAVAKREEHLVFQIKSCNGYSYDKDHSKPGRKTKPTDSIAQGESRRSQLPKPYSDSKQLTFLSRRSIQGCSDRKGSRYYDEENSNCYDVQYDQTGSQFIDDYESTRGRHEKRGVPRKTPDNFNRNAWNSSVTHNTGSKVVNNNQSNKNRLSQFFLTTGTEFKADIDSNRSVQSKGASYASKYFKDGGINRNRPDNAFVSTAGSKYRDDNNSNRENYQGSKFVDQSQRHINNIYQNRGVPKTQKLDQNGDRSNYTLVSTSHKFRNDVDSNLEKISSREFGERNHIDVKENFVHEDESRHLNKGSDNHAGSGFSDRGDSNRAARGSVGSDNKFKMDELGNRVDKRRSMGSTKPDVQIKSKCKDNCRVEDGQSLYSEKPPELMSYPKRYPQYENYTKNLYDDVKSVYGEDDEFNNDKESRSFDLDEGRNKDQKGVDEKTFEKPRSDSMFRKLVRRMTSLVIPSFSKKPYGVDGKPLLTDEEPCCNCFCRTKQSREGTALKIKIKNEKEADAARVWNIPLTNKKVLSYALLISLMTTAAVLATCWQGTLIIPYYSTQVDPSFWELLKE